MAMAENWVGSPASRGVPNEPIEAAFSVATIVEEETCWRERPRVAAALPTRRISASRWRALDKDVREVEAQTPDTSYVIGIAMRNLHVRLSVGSRVVQDGAAPPGTVFVTAPGVVARGV